jgi:hypothetical protein
MCISVRLISTWEVIHREGNITRDQQKPTWIFGLDEARYAAAFAGILSLGPAKHSGPMFALSCGIYLDDCGAGSNYGTLAKAHPHLA